MKFHFMARNINTEFQALKKITQKASDSGFYSMLMTYHSRQEDFWIKSARIIDDSIKMKMMIAIRTYAISPEYCAMMLASCNSISNDKIILNIVSGDLHSDETSVEDIVEIKNLIENSEKRLKYTEKWLNKFKSLDLIKNQIPEIVISGTSKKSIENINNYGDYGLATLDYCLSNTNNFSKNKKIMAAAPIFIFENNENSNDILNAINPSRLKRTIYGTREEIYEKIKYIKSNGITDLLLNTDNEIQLQRLFEFIKDASLDNKNDI